MTRFLALVPLCGVLLCSALPSPAVSPVPIPDAAVPEAVTLYPDEARVVVRQSLPVAGDGILRLRLPPGTLADSVALNVEGRTVRDLSLISTKAGDSPEMRVLREGFEAARRALRQLEGELVAVQARQALWTRSETRFTQAGDVDRMDQFLAQKLPELHAAELRIADDIEPARAEYARLEQAMRDAGALDDEALSLSARLNPPAVATTVQATLT
jgi:hypothetical protein